MIQKKIKWLELDEHVFSRNSDSDVLRKVFISMNKTKIDEKHF